MTMPMQLQEISAMIDLACLQNEQTATDIGVCSKVLHEVLDSCSRLQLHEDSNLLPTSAAAQMLHTCRSIPQHVPLEDVAAALCEPQRKSSKQLEPLVRLDSLLGLICLLAAGDVGSKLQLCCEVLVQRDGSNSVSLPKLLQMLSGVPLTSAAAQIILGQATLKSVAAMYHDPFALAAQQQRMQVLEAVVTQAFGEADPAGTGYIQPGLPMQQLLFSIAAQLTAIIVGTVTVPEPPASEAAATTTVDGSPAGTASSAVSRNSSRSTSSLELVQQQQQPSTCLQPGQQSVSGRLSVHQTAPTWGSTKQQQSSSTSPRADVVIMDEAGDCLHYTTTVAEAAAAASAGRLPVSSSEVHVYQHAAGAGQQQRGLAPAESLTKQLSLMVEAKQQQQQQQRVQLQVQDRDSAATESSRASMFLTPVPSVAGTAHPNDDVLSPMAAASAAVTGMSPGPSGSGAGDSYNSLRSRSRLASAAQMSKRMLRNIQRATSEELLPAVAPVPADQGVGTAAAAGSAAAGRTAGSPAGPGATQAITSTAGTLARALQRNVAAASVRVLVHCSVCFLLTTMVILGDAALVAGLHVAAGMPLATSFGITVGANMVLALVLFAALLVVRCFNTATGRNIEQAISGPEAQQIDYILNNINTAIELLKKSEEQSGGAQHRPGSTAYNSNSTSAVRRTSSYGREHDPEAGFGAPAAGLGKLRTVWSTVGRMAGFLQQAEDIGRHESLQSQGPPSPVLGHGTLIAGSGDAVNLQQQQLGTAVGMTDSGGLSSAGGSGVASIGQSTSGVEVRSSAGLQSQSRSARVRGIGGGMGPSAPGKSIQQAYPQT